MDEQGVMDEEDVVGEEGVMEEGVVIEVPRRREGLGDDVLDGREGFEKCKDSSHRGVAGC